MFFYMEHPVYILPIVCSLNYVSNDILFAIYFSTIRRAFSELYMEYA